jgi:hypothetical protein
MVPQFAAMQATEEACLSPLVTGIAMTVATAFRRLLLGGSVASALSPLTRQAVLLAATTRRRPTSTARAAPSLSRLCRPSPP